MSAIELRPPPARCRPPFWARGAHAQTVLGHLLPSGGPALRSGAPGVETVRVELPDGDALVGHELAGETEVLVHLFHGLGSTANEAYMRRAAAVVRARGHGVFAVNHRGCGEGQGLAKGTYHSGSAADLGAAIARARERHPEKRHLAIGFSLSGNALLLLLARGEPCLPDLALAVNPPIDLASASRRMSEGANRIYDLHYVAAARRLVRARRRAGLPGGELRIPRLARLSDLEDAITAPLGGFADRGEYHARCSARERLRDIRTPTAILTARDDPFISAEGFESARRAPCVHVHVEERGGHMGYLSGGRGGLGVGRWLDGAIGHYVDGLVALPKDG